MTAVTAIDELNAIAIPPHAAVMITLDDTGDTKHYWDRRKPDEVEAARELFNSLKKKGYTAYRINNKSGDERGEVMREFDPEAEKVLFAPRTVGG